MIRIVEARAKYERRKETRVRQQYRKVGVDSDGVEIWEWQTIPSGSTEEKRGDKHDDQGEI